MTDEIPAYLLVPASARYNPGGALEVLGDHELHRYEDPDRRHVLRFPIWPQISLDFDRPTARYESVAAEVLTFYRKEYRYEVRHRPHERRRLAREGSGRGRRRGKPVPLAIRGQVYVYQPEGAPEKLILRALDKRKPITQTVWHCPYWRRGAPIWSFGR